MTGYMQSGNVPGQLLSPDISAFHQVYDWDEQYLQIRSSPEVSVRYRIRLRYPGADDTGMKVNAEVSRMDRREAVKQLYLQSLSDSGYGDTGSAGTTTG